MSQSDFTGAAGAAGGFAFYSYGTRIIVNNPWTNFRWSFYEGPLTPGRGGPDQALADVLRRGGIGFNERMHDVAPGSMQGVRGNLQVNNFNHETAVQAEVARIQANQSVHENIATQNVSPNMRNLNGGARNLDIRYQTRSFLYGATNNYTEVKTGYTQFRGNAGGTPRVQAQADVANLANLNGRVSGIRMLGQGLRVAGAVGAVLSVGVTTAQAATQFSSGNTRGGARTVTGFLGGLVGGLAAGAAAGAVAGTLVGPLGTIAGGIVGGVIGLGAGITGGIFGESLANSAFDQLWAPTTSPQSNASTPQPGLTLPSPPSQFTPLPPVVLKLAPFDLPPADDPNVENPLGLPSSVDPTVPALVSELSISPSAALQLSSPASLSQQLSLASANLSGSNGSGLDLASFAELQAQVNYTQVSENIFNDLGAAAQLAVDEAMSQLGYSGDLQSFLSNYSLVLPDSGSDTGHPVLLDLSGNGINIAQLSSSNTWFDTVGDGYQHRTAWAGVGNGVLVYDTNGDGQITQANQINFTLWDPTAKSDMQALLDVFDTNHDGKLDAGDANFSKFKVLVTNADGTQTLETLSQLGITSINLNENATSIALPDGSSIDGTTSFTRTDGSTGEAATVTLASEAQGYKVGQTITHNADGSTTIDNKAFNPDGSLSSETITLTSADGKTRTISFDDNGDGVIDRIQTDVTATAANGAVNETVSNYQGASLASAYLVDRTVTTTSSNAGGKTVSIDRDTTGDGLFNQNETQVTGVSGTLTDTITDYNPDGSVADQTTSTLTNNGLNRTDKYDLDGSGVIDLTRTDNTVISAVDQSRTETVSEFNGNGSLRDQTTTITSASGADKTVAYDYNGDGIIDQTNSPVISAATNGSSVTTQKDTNNDGSLIGASQTTISSDGLSKITLIDSFGATDASHNPVYNLQNSDVTVVNADQSRTQTLSSYIYANGTPTKLVSETQIIKGADGITRTTEIDANGALDAQNNPIWNSIETVAIDAAHNNNVVDTLKITNHDGTLSNETVSTTSADGLTVTTQSDQGGNVDASNNPIFDSIQTVVTTKNTDKSSTVVTTDMGGDGHTVIDTTTTTTSANGLTVATTSNVGGDNTTTTDTTTINPDGSRKEIVQVTAPGVGANPTPVVLSTTETDTSADQKTTVVKEDSYGDGVVNRLKESFSEASGATVDRVSDFAPNGSLISKTQDMRSANGLAKTDTTNIDGKVDSITTDVTVLNIDGSSTETVTKRANDGTMIGQTAATTSGNGFSSTATTSIDGKVDSTVTDIKSIAANGDQTDVTTTYDSNNAKVNVTQVTSSANGLSKTTLIDENGDGVFDIQTTDQNTLNLTDGSVTKLVTTTTVAASPVTLGRAQTFTSADGLTVITSVDHTGDGVYDEVTKVVKDAAGNEVTTGDHYDPNNNKLNETVTTTHANGLFKETQTDKNGDGTFDRTQTDSTALNQDGSQTETVTTLAGTTTVGTTVATTTANGTLVTTQNYIDGTAATGTLVETDQTQTTYNLDGTITRTATVASQNGAVVEQSTTQTSADRKTTTITTNHPQTQVLQGILPESSLETQSLQPDGSLKDTVNYYASASASGTLLASKTTQTSANGLSKTLSFDLNGEGTNDEVQSDVTAIGTDGSTTETFSETDAFPGTSFVTGTSFTENVGVTTVTSANGLTSNVSSSINLGEDWSTLSEARKQYINPDGSAVEVTTSGVTGLHATSGSGSGSSTNYVGIYAGSDAALVSMSRDGLTKTTQISTWGNNTFYRTDSLTTHLDGSTTETITNLNDDNSVGEAETVNVSADRRTVSVTDQTSEDGFTNYAVRSTIPTNDSIGNAVSLTTTSNYTASGGTQLNTETQSTLFDGLSKTTTLDTYGGGFADETKTDVTTLSPDGRTIETITETDASGSQIKQEVVTTSADGLHKTVTIAGSGAVLATTQSDTVDNTDGSTTTTAITTSPGPLGLTLTRNKTVINTSADGRVTNVTWDLNGDGLTDATETSVTDVSGARAVTDTYYQPDGATVSSTVTTATTANGRMTTVSRTIAASPTSNTTETTLLSAAGSGSYSWTEKDASGNELVYADHTIDQNGIDYIDLRVHGTEVTYKISAAQEAKDLAQVESIYTVLLGRTMSPEETQAWLKYYTNSGLNVTQLATDLMNSAEYWQDYGAPSWFGRDGYYASSFTNTLFENAFGRVANVSELLFWGDWNGNGSELDLSAEIARRAEVAVEIARIANPAGVANAQFNLQASSPYPLPFGAGGGGGGGVPDSITTYSNTLGTIIAHYDPLTGFLQSKEYYSGSLNYLTDYYDPTTGNISTEDGYFFNQSGTQITDAYVASGNKIDFYEAAFGNPNDLLSRGNQVLDITNNSNGTSTWIYRASPGVTGLPLATINYSGAASINHFSTTPLTVGGYLVSSAYADPNTGIQTQKFLISGTAGPSSEYEVIERSGGVTELAFGETFSNSSQFTFYDPAHQFANIPSLASFIATYSITQIGYASNGPDGLGAVTSSWAHSSNPGYPDSVFTNFLGSGWANLDIFLADMLPEGIGIPVNTQYNILTAPGTGPATGASNAPTTPAGGFTFTPPTFTPATHVIDTRPGYVSGTGEDTYIYNAGYGSVEINEDAPSTAPQNVLELGSTILPSSIRVTADGSGNLYIADGTSGDDIELAGMLSDNARGVQSVQFTSNNTTWTRAQLIQAETTGTTGADRLYGTSGAEVFDGKGGNDYVSGGGGGDTFVYNSGYGQLEIDERDTSASPNNILQMTGTNSANVTVLSDGTNLYMTDGIAGDLIKIDNFASDPLFGVQTVQFADTIWHVADLQSRMKSPIFGSPTASDTLVGTSGADYFDGRGVPAGQTDVITGGGGNDVFAYNKGYGSLEINENGAAGYESILKLGPNIAHQNVTIEADAAGDMILLDGVAGDQVKLDNYFNGATLGPQVIQFVDGTFLTKAGVNNVTVFDTAANVSANIAGLNANSYLTSITLTDAGTPTLALTATQVATDTVALGKISNSAYNIAVSDTAANVSGNIAALNANTHLASIVLTDTGTPTLTLTVAQALQDATALGKVLGSYRVAISDTLANVMANITALASDTQLSSIALTDIGTPSLTLSAAQVATDNGVLAKIGNAYAIAVSDTAANVAANIGALNANPHISGIALTDSGTPTLTLTGAQITADASVLNKITSSYNVTATFDGPRSEYLIRSYFANGVLNTTVTDDGSAGDGTAQLTNVTNLKFSDETITTPLPSANRLANFDGRPYDDVLYQSQQNDGLPYVALTFGNPTGTGNAYGTLSSSTYVGGVGDINGDGIADVVVQDTSNGMIYAIDQHLVGGPTVTTVGPGNGFYVVGVGDINGDGYADIVLQNPTTGVIECANMAHGQLSGLVVLGPDVGWNIVGVGDFKGNGYDDILLENMSTGQLAYGDMTGGLSRGIDPITTLASGIQVCAVADFNGDGHADILIRNDNPGHASDALQYINMSGGTDSGLVTALAAGDLTSDLVVKGAADINNSGYSDILVQSVSTGQTFWAGENASGWTGTNGNVLSAIGPTYQVVQTPTDGLVMAASGNDTLVASQPDSTLIGDGNYDSYKYNAGTQNERIVNSNATGSTATGELDFGPGITDQNLWFAQSGDNLTITVIDGQPLDQITVVNWFANDASKLSEIKDSSGLKLDGGLNSLIQSMATYANNNPGFNPAGLAQAPNNTTLQNAIAASWH